MLANNGYLTTFAYGIDGRPARITLLVLFALIGFGIGWMISPKARDFRRLSMLALVTINGKVNTITYDRDRHLITVAPTRSGKGVVSIIPNLLTYPGSVLVIDPKGENAMITARQREAMGQRIYVVDPWGIAGKSGFKAARFNPMD